MNVFHVIALALICLVVGFRNEVGNDWGAYVTFFNGFQFYSFDSVFSGEYEIGFGLMNYLLARANMHYTVMFFLIALFTWAFFFKSLDIRILPILIFFVFTDEYFFWSMNVIRQFMAMAMFLYSIQFIIQRRLIYFVGLIALATLFHTSAIIMLPVYWLPVNKLYKPRIWFVIYLVTIFLSNTSIINTLMTKLMFALAEFIPLLSVYLNYFGGEKLLAAKIAIGLGYLFKILVGIFIFLFCEKVTDKYPSTKIYFVLFFFGAIIFNLFYMIHLIDRINHYFILMRSVILSLIVYHLWVEERKKLLVWTFTGLYFFLFLMAIYNSSNMSNPYRVILP